jgi:hypothetical protein
VDSKPSIPKAISFRSQGRWRQGAADLVNRILALVL